ncbi:MAG: hypothetical protein EBY29_12510 [Planctomycetes bacterium]|nr:hypothetical protein [Planctomycetota bacterium]
MILLQMRAPTQYRIILLALVVLDQQVLMVQQVLQAPLAVLIPRFSIIVEALLQDLQTSHSTAQPSPRII